MQQLKSIDHSQYYRYPDLVLKQQVHNDFSNKIFFNNETYFSHDDIMIIFLLQMNFMNGMVYGFNKAVSRVRQPDGIWVGRDFHISTVS